MENPRKRSKANLSKSPTSKVEFFHMSVSPLPKGAVLSTGLWGEKTNSMRASNYPQYMKEMIFEEVRASLFPHAPSRLSSVFLFPDLVSARFYRANWMKYGAHIYEIEILSGNPFVVEMDLLNCNGAAYPTIKSKAEKYWNQVQHNFSQTLEAVLQGEARVGDVIEFPSTI